MDCPVCHVELRMTDRQGVEIDYCPQCRGVWLDRGELDKLIERSGPSPRQSRDYRPDDREEYRDHDHHKRHKPKSFLKEIFDF